jgi:hypothetical protein
MGDETQKRFRDKSTLPGMRAEHQRQRDENVGRWGDFGTLFKVSRLDFLL